MIWLYFFYYKIDEDRNESQTLNKINFQPVTYPPKAFGLSLSKAEISEPAP